MKYILILMLLVGCGPDLVGNGEVDSQELWPEQEKPVIKIDENAPGHISAFVHEEVATYLEDFIYLMDYYEVTPPIPMSDLTIDFNDLSSISTKTAGRCRITVDLMPTVTISQRHWDEYSDWSREELIFHELGHCLLVRDHEEEWDTENNRPISLMYPRIIPMDIYSANVNYYREELFSKTSTWDIVTKAMEEPKRNTGRNRPGYELKPVEYLIYAEN